MHSQDVDAEFVAGLGPVLGEIHWRTRYLAALAESLLIEQFGFPAFMAWPDNRTTAIEILAGGGLGALWFWGVK